MQGEAGRRQGRRTVVTTACCEALARKISDYHDGLLSPDGGPGACDPPRGGGPPGGGDCSAVEEHLATCPRCAELLEDYRAVSFAAKLVPCAECTEAQIERISRRVRARIRSQVFRRRLAWTGASVGVAAAAAVLLAVMLGGPGPAGDASSGPPGAASPRPDAGRDGNPPRPGCIVSSGAPQGRPRAAAGEPDERLGREKLRRRLEAESRTPPAPGIVRVGEGDKAAMPEPPAGEPPLLGLLLADAPAGRKGARIVGVERGSPAAEAGFRPDDLLLKIGDEDVTGPAAAADLVNRAGPGSKIRITYARGGDPPRGGETHEVEVVLAGEKRD